MFVRLHPFSLTQSLKEKSKEKLINQQKKTPVNIVKRLHTPGSCDFVCKYANARMLCLAKPFISIST